MTRLPDPLSRRDRQRQTREALVVAARATFAQDGYHAASLEGIAREAGFSKGAVYSNFESKAALFLAVMDANMEIALTESWDPFSRELPPAVADELSEGQLEEAMTGFGLATLEFVAMAARDETLRAEMAKRMARLLDAYTEIAREQHAEDDRMSAEQLGALIAALDQGSGMLTLSGSTAIDQGLLRAGARRLLDPARAAELGDDDEGGFALHDREVQRRIAEALRERG